jgi:hypothetical protein
LIISRPDRPSSLLATESILIPASSSTFESRWLSAVRCSISFLRYAEARIMPIAGQVARPMGVAGMKASA